MRKFIRCFALTFVLCQLIASCASMGSPDGGRYDEEPPVVVSSTPLNGAVNSQRKKISIHFDEYIKLENANEKVVVSPPQTETPNIRAVGKQVKIDLYDTLRPNTTYTIDFSDAIVDNNEGNPMGKYTFSFSTGETIDTMEVSGTVLAAENLEPVKGMLVGLYPLDSLWNDTVFTSAPLTRVSRTNGCGQFTIKGVRSGDYRVFALQDQDGNFFFSQKSEAIAFDTVRVTTSSRPDLRPDTVWVDSTHIDRIRMVPYIHFFPDDLVLNSFLEGGQDKHLLKTERLVPENFTLYFTAPQDSMPVIQGLNFDPACLLAEPREHCDTITYWITDTLVAHSDTLQLQLSYFDTDSLGIDQWYTSDTLTLFPKTSYAKQQKERQKKIEEWEKDREKKMKRAKEPLPPEKNPYLETFLEVAVKPSGSIDPNQNVTFTFSEPISALDSSLVHFFQKVDSQYVDCPYLLLPVEGELRQYCLYAEWEPKAQYLFEADSLAFKGALGHTNKSFKQELRVRSADEFGAIFIRLVGAGDQDSCVVELLNKSDKPVAKQLAEKGRADFYYLKPSEYYLRMFIDRNGNGIWDTGDYRLGLQPEEVFYFPQPIPVRAKFDVEQSWDFRSIPRAKQKPVAITKQKADKQKKIKDRNRERERELNR
ncbi:MAG: Ig-like domain-containing protein [Bacteroidaceae bacterium]|nr:Ig-like domain-containing protein [Bacteroidaceae bacterium]